MLSIFFIEFLSHVKISKDSSVKCYQNNIERLQNLVINIEAFPKKKKKKSNNVDIKDVKIYLKLEGKYQLGIEKNIIKYGNIKMLDK